MEQTIKKQSNKVSISPEFLKRILIPYREETSYLKNATLIFDSDKKYPLMQGDFGIQESCYIDDTGHFNAVEFNICYNQIGYTYLGHCIKEGLLPELEGFSKNNCDVFFEKQLSHILIVKIESVYKKPINAKKFYGEIEVLGITKKAKCTFIKFSCKYYDDNDGNSFGEVTLAILNP